jgi:hypothetical protein
VGRAPVFDNAQAPSGNLVGHAVIKQNHAIGNILFQPMPRKSAFAALSGDNRRYAPVLKPAKQPPQFRAQNALILQSRKQILDRVEHHAGRPDGVDRRAQPYEQPFQIVIAGFINFAALDAYEIDDQLLFSLQYFQIKSERANILRKLGGRFLKRHEDARLAIFHGSANQKFGGQQGLTRSGTAANKCRTPPRKPAASNLIQTLNAGGRFGQTPILFAIPLGVRGHTHPTFDTSLV